MGLSRRMFTKEFKLAAVRRLKRGSSIGEVARALEVNPNVLHRWRREGRQGPGNAFPGHGKQRWADRRIGDLECKIGRDRFFEGVLAAHRGTADAAGVDSKSAVYQRSAAGRTLFRDRPGVPDHPGIAIWGAELARFQGEIYVDSRDYFDRFPVDQGRLVDPLLHSV